MTLQFKIQLKGMTKPPIWRKVHVPAHFSFEKFHSVIQAAFGWDNSHLFMFSPNGYRSSPQILNPGYSDWDGNEILNSKKIKLSQFFKTKGQKFTYIYDFGDDWIHIITLEDVNKLDSKNAVLISGKGACPPEDCGGIWGYYNLLEVIEDPQHEEYEEMREWLGLKEGEQWDQNHFDKEAAIKAVASI
jgi:hypothetical protein